MNILSNIPDSTGSRKEIENIVKDKVISDMISMKNSVPKAERPLFETFLDIYEAKILKTIISCSLTGDTNNIESNVTYLGHITESFVKDITSASNRDEIIAALKIHPFLKGYSGEATIEELIHYTDTVLTTKLTSIRFKVPPSIANPISEFTGRYIDIGNLNTILRGKLFGENPEITESHIILPGFQLSEAKLKELAKAENITEVISGLSGTYYSEIINSEAAFNTDAVSQRELGKLIDRLYLDMANRFRSSYALTVGPSIKYLLTRFIEEKNMRALLMGRFVNLNKEDIEDMITLEA